LSYKITLIPTDRTEPEITNAASRICENAGVNIEYEDVDAGIKALLEVIEKGEDVAGDINLKKFAGKAEFADAVIKEL